jgi:hypothetical protein
MEFSEVRLRAPAYTAIKDRDLVLSSPYMERIESLRRFRFGVSLGSEAKQLVFMRS